MIKNKILDIKIIFKIYLKILKNRLKIFEVFKRAFVLQNIKEQFYKIVFKNCF